MATERRSSGSSEQPGKVTRQLRWALIGVGVSTALSVAAVIFAASVWVDLRDGITTRVLTVASPMGRLYLGPYTRTVNGKTYHDLGVRVLDPSGKARVALAAVNGPGGPGAALSLKDQGVDRLNVFTDSTNTTGVVIFDSEGNLRAALTNAQQDTGLILQDARGKAHLGAVLSAKGLPEISLTDSNGQDRIDLGLDARAMPSVTLSDANGHDRTVIGATALEARGESWRRTESSIVIFGATGNLEWSAPSALP